MLTKILIASFLTRTLNDPSNFSCISSVLALTYSITLVVHFLFYGLTFELHSYMTFYVFHIEILHVYHVLEVNL